MFYDFRVWLCRALEPYGMEISQYNDMDGIWETSKFIPSFRWAYSRSMSFKVMRSRKSQTENFGFGRCDTCFWVRFSWRTRIMTLGHFLNIPNRTNFEIGKKQKSPEIAWQMAVFDLQNAKTQTFFKIYTWNFVHVYNWHGSLTYIPVWKFDDSLHFFERIFFYFSQFSVFLIENPR